MKKSKQKSTSNFKSTVNLDFYYHDDILKIEKQTELRYPDGDIGYHNGDENILSACVSKTISYTKLFNFIIEELNLTDRPVDTLYCIDRILRIHKIYDPEIFDVDIRDGFYGDEIDKVHIKYGIANEIDQHIKVVALKDISIEYKIEYVLNLEYGYILETLKDKKYEIKENVPFSQLRVGNDNYYEKLSKGSNKYELIPGLPVGLYLKRDDGTYRLVDGYHRLVSLDKEKSYTIIVVE